MSPVDQGAFARALLHPDVPVPSGIVTAWGAGDRGRFAIYRNNVHVSLTRALAARFPVVERLVGAAFFAAMAGAFVRDHKPASPLIFDYGNGFPDFIAAFPPAGELHYLADVARIEAARTHAYHAADAVVLPLAALNVEDLAGMRLRRHPAAALIRSPHPAGSIWAAHQAEMVVPLGARQAECVLVTRPDLEVAVSILPARDAVFAEAAMAGRNLGEAARTALAAALDFDFGAALVGLVSRGAFAGVEQGDA